MQVAGTSEQSAQSGGSMRQMQSFPAPFGGDHSRQGAIYGGVGSACPFRYRAQWQRAYLQAIELMQRRQMRALGMVDVEDCPWCDWHICRPSMHAYCIAER